MKYILIFIASLAFFACRVSKTQTVSQSAKTADSTAVKVFKEDTKKSKDSIVKNRGTNKARRVVDSGYSKTTTINESYSDEFDFGSDSDSVPATIKDPVKRKLLRRTVVIQENGKLSRSENTSEHSASDIKLHTNDTVNVSDSTVKTGSASEYQYAAKTTKTQYVFSWWWLLIIVAIAVVYWANKKFGIWQNIRNRF